MMSGSRVETRLPRCRSHLSRVSLCRQPARAPDALPTLDDHHGHANTLRTGRTAVPVEHPRPESTCVRTIRRFACGLGRQVGNVLLDLWRPDSPRVGIRSDAKLGPCSVPCRPHPAAGTARSGPPIRSRWPFLLWNPAARACARGTAPASAGSPRTASARVCAAHTAAMGPTGAAVPFQPQTWHQSLVGSRAEGRPRW